MKERSCQRDGHQEFLEFFNSLARRYQTREASKSTERIGASWLNLVERWFGLINQHASPRQLRQRGGSWSGR
jgi:hypothetical protein